MHRDAYVMKVHLVSMRNLEGTYEGRHVRC